MSWCQNNFIEVDFKVDSEEGEDPGFPKEQSDDHLYWNHLGQRLGLGFDFFKKKNEKPLFLIKEGCDRISFELVDKK